MPRSRRSSRRLRGLIRIWLDCLEEKIRRSGRGGFEIGEEGDLNLHLTKMS
jgi:hypothetical protein